MKYLATLVVLATVVAPAIADPDAYLKAKIELLKDGTEDEKLRAVRDIKELGPSGTPAIPALAEAIKEGPPARRVEIAKLLAGYGLAAREAIPVFVAVIREPQSDGTLFTESLNAIAALGDAGNRDVVIACLLHESQGRGGKRVGGAWPEYLARHAVATVPVVADLLADQNPNIRQRAALTLAVMAASTPTKPSPMTNLSRVDRDRTVASLRTAIDGPDPRVREFAASALLDLDPSAVRAAVPVLLRAVHRRDSHIAESAALVRAGTPAARLIIEYLDEPNPNERQSVIGCLSQFGDSALPALADGLRHPNARIREGVVRSLQYANRGAKLRAGLSARLHDADPGVRVAAAATLAAADRTRAGAAVPVLSELAFDRDPSRRAEALVTLRLLGPTARPALPDLLRRVRSGDIETRLTAAEALMEIDRTTWRSYLPALVAALKSANAPQRQRAINRLRDTGPDALTALPALRECFRDEDGMTRVLAAEAVFKIAPDAIEDVVGCLASVLKGMPAAGRRNNRTWRAAIRAIDKIGPAAKGALPALIEVIRFDPESSLAPEAAVVAIRLDPENAGEVYDMFRIHLSPGYPDFDEEWLYRIHQLKQLAKPLIPDLIAAMWSKSASQREFAFDALASLGSDAKEALPALREVAKGKQDAARAAEAIKAIEKK